MRYFFRLRSKYNRWKFQYVIDKEKRLRFEQRFQDSTKVPANTVNNFKLKKSLARGYNKVGTGSKHLHYRSGPFQIRDFNLLQLLRLHSNIGFPEKTSLDHYFQELKKADFKDNGPLLARRAYGHPLFWRTAFFTGRHSLFRQRIYGAASKREPKLSKYKLYAYNYLKTLGRFKRWLSRHPSNKNKRFYRLIRQRRYARRKHGIFPNKAVKYYYSVIKFIRLVYGFSTMYQVRSFIRRARYCYKVCKFHKFYSLLESRLVTALLRAGYSSSYLNTDYLLRNRFILINGKHVFSRNFSLRVGDLISSVQFTNLLIRGSRPSPFSKLNSPLLNPVLMRLKIYDTYQGNSFRQVSTVLLNSLNSYRLNLHTFTHFSGVSGTWFFILGTLGYLSSKFLLLRKFGEHHRSIDALHEFEEGWKYAMNNSILKKKLNFDNSNKAGTRLFFWKGKRYGSSFYLSDKASHIFKNLTKWYWSVPHHWTLFDDISSKRSVPSSYIGAGCSSHPINVHSNTLVQSSVFLDIPPLATFRLPHPVYKKKKFSAALLRSVFNKINKA